MDRICVTLWTTIYPMCVLVPFNIQYPPLSQYGKDMCHIVVHNQNFKCVLCPTIYSSHHCNFQATIWTHCFTLYTCQYWLAMPLGTGVTIEKEKNGSLVCNPPPATI